MSDEETAQTYLEKMVGLAAGVGIIAGSLLTVTFGTGANLSERPVVLQRKRSAKSRI